jgi:hypothetical protein
MYRFLEIRDSRRHESMFVLRTASFERTVDPLYCSSKAPHAIVIESLSDCSDIFLNAIEFARNLHQH